MRSIACLTFAIALGSACSTPSSEETPPGERNPAPAAPDGVGRSTDGRMSDAGTHVPTSPDVSAPAGGAPGTSPDGGAIAPDPARPDATAPIVVDKEPPPAAPSTEARADGAACTTADQCASGICEGQGCGVDEGVCARATRPCTRDLKSYCGCDGKTFRASGTCPLRRFTARGMCADDESAPR